ncbi:DNA topoisomerase 2-alpha like protein [Argiope bruennichi]|uniref:DNA topoisomerase 2 n=1 Tax=Argiope bruennichi TaxID=94029 RepID=A0A8T0EHX2_ARGBR|nr:DNA topoisomerase 2-alpha like protein [Argiope bruennichi]
MANSIEMDGDWEIDDIAVKAPKGNKKLSVERIYQKKTQLEHILLRPDTYIGSVEPVTQTMWVYDEGVGLVNREVTYVPGLYKIFDEILVNAADNKQRDKNMDMIKIEINPEKNKICIWNNGRGIPVVEHKDEKMFVPSLIFGHLLTSSNYNDDERKVTGGRNGYGAKLCNIFSTKFTVETASKDYHKQFKQTWKDNMTKAEEPKIQSFSGSDFTCITFYPDLTKFKMTVLDKDIVAIMTRRAYDIAGCARGVKVILNDKRLPVKSFKDYIGLYLTDKTDENGDPLKIVHEVANERWEIAVTMSSSGYQHVSFVNSIATTKGGRHVDYITDQLTSKIVEVIKKKNKGGKDVKPFQIKSHLWVFVNCLIENPTFDSQTKENMTLQVKNFGSKCQLSEKFVNQAMKCGVVESIMSWIRFKAQTELEKKCSGKKHTKLRGIPKLEDANDAGTKNSIDCTLILTEGDSAKSLAVSGLGVVGRDKYGVFPLKGKILNVREASHKQILENAEINNIIKIMGLQYKKKYESVDDLKTLRYGRLMIMTDQDQDGSHIKGLLINFIHHNWPSLLRLPFLEEFITPIVKATKGKEEKCFYSLPEFEEWKAETPNWNKYKVKYYKGLGTSTSKEAKEYFSDMKRHRIRFHYSGTEDDNAIQLAFSKKMVDMRKEWLTNGMEERKRRRELGLPELYLYDKNTTAVTYNDFVNKELILFSNMDNERSIPSAVDGFKPGQRKVLFTCLKRNDKREVKVAQLVGSVAEQSAYHHGEQALAGTIIGLAQDFVGSNNINVLLPVGQFGTRLQGGKDAASPRYIFTMLSPVTRHLFSSFDSPLLNHLYDDNLKIEPEYYVPIIPMVLVNGAEGIGTGWSTKVPNYNPRDLVKNIYRLLDDNKIEITELPIRTWTQAYKENVLEPMVHGTEKTPAFITDYKEYHTDTTVRFVVKMTPEKFQLARNQGFHKTFKLQTSISLSSMVLFDHLGALRKYENPEHILKEFYEVRFVLYEKRKNYMVGALEAESLKLKNQARFIVEKCDNKITIENRRKAEMIKLLQDRGYDSDPLKAWKESQKTEEEEKVDEESDTEKEERTSGPDYDYLLGMTLWNLTREKKDELLKKRDEKIKELNDLKSKSPSDLWRNDLKKKTTGKKKASDEDKPSPFGERVDPTIDEEYKKKWEKKPTVPGEAKKGRKKKLPDIKEEDGDDPKEKKGAAKSPKKNKRNPWSDSESNEDISDLSTGISHDYIPPEKREMAPRRAAVKKKYNFDSDERNSDKGSEKPTVQNNVHSNSDSDSEFKIEVEKPAPKVAPKKRARKVSDGSSDDDFKPKAKKEAPAKAKKPAAPRKKAVPKEGGGAAAKKPSKPKAKPKKKSGSDDEFALSDNDAPTSQTARQPRTGRTKAPTKFTFDSDSDDDF